MITSSSMAKRQKILADEGELIVVKGKSKAPVEEEDEEEELRKLQAEMAM